MAPTVVKKYPNRRLYDTGDSRYVTLDELAAKVRGGTDVRVVDATNGDDLTQATLTQIVLETGHAAKFLPVQLLNQMIRLSDDSLAEFFSRYVTSALDMYLQAKRGVQSLSAYNPLAQLPLAAGDALARMWMPMAQMAAPQAPPWASQPGAYTAREAAAGYGPPPPPPVEPEPEAAAREAAAESRNGDVAAMRRELDELKEALREGLGQRAPKKKRKS